MSLAERIRAFAGLRVVVAGDLCADCYVETRPGRLSREAPVMVLRYVRHRYLPGCAANTAMNLRALGARVAVLGALGEDEAGAALRDAFAAAGVDTEGVAAVPRTTVKVRVTSGESYRPQQQVIRVDLEPDGWEPSRDLAARAELAAGADAIVISDYGYGAASPALLDALRAHAPAAPACVDSRFHSDAYRGVDLLTPNEAEAEALLRRRIERDEDAADAARALRERTGACAVLLTRGNRGMLLFDGDVHAFPIEGSADIVDPTGAGDTVVATAALARAAGAGHLEAARLANFAAGVVVMKTGAATVTPEELEEAVSRG